MATAGSIPLMSSDHVKAAINDFAGGFNYSYYQPLHSAILNGDWKSTEAFIDNDPSALTAKIAVLGRTALHLAAVGAQWELVEKLVQHQHMPASTELKTSTMNDYKFLQSFVSPEIIFSATSFGIVEILKTCFHFFPHFVWTHIPNEGYVVHTAIKNRQEKVFSLLCKMPIICKLLVLELDESQNTTSHLAARFSSQVESISGAAFQMQREIQRFKEIEKMDDPLHKEVKNKDGKTPWQLFKEEHKTLLEEAKNWIKDRSNSYMLVATLIATITFSAAITVPGGNKQDKGIPIFLTDKTFIAFVVLDALAFLFSMTSLVMFLSAINGGYTEVDFLMNIPIKLVFGSNCLLLAVVTTTVAFVAALSMFLEKGRFIPMIFFSLFILPYIVGFGFRFRISKSWVILATTRKRIH